MANTGMDTPTDSPGTALTTDQLFTEKDACAYLRVSKRNLYCWRMAGLIPYFKIGRAVRFRKTELDAALERMQVGAVVKSIKVGAQVGEALW
jgi:excisionase family DNA binding protein